MLKEDTKDFDKLQISPNYQPTDVFEEYIIKEKRADLGTDEYDGSTSYQKCYRSFDEFMTFYGDTIYNSHDEFTEPTGEYYIKINDDHYEYIRREIVEQVDEGWIYNGTKNVTVNKTLISFKKLELSQDYLW